MLRRTLPDDVVGQSIVGDLDQEFQELLDKGRSPARTRLWYRWEACKLAARWSVERLRPNPREQGGADRLLDGDVTNDIPPTHRRRVSGRTGGWTMGWIQDARYGLRMLAKTPLVTLVAVVSLAFGISASTTMFSIYWAFLFAPLPYESPEQLVAAEQTRRTDAGFGAPTSPGAFHGFVEGSSTIYSWAAWRTGSGNLTGSDEPMQVTLTETYPATFGTLGRQPFLGRDFTMDDGRPGAAPTAILHYDLWAGRFDSDPSIVGQTVSVDGTVTTVIGVMPEGFDLMAFAAGARSIYLPTTFEEERESWTSRTVGAVGRLGSGVSVEAASAELASILERAKAQRGEDLEPFQARASLLREQFPGDSDRRLVQVLLAVGLFVLFLAAANVANLLLAKAEARQGEVSIRTALGAGRTRILRQLLTESLMLALIGAGAGVALAYFGIRGMQAAMPPAVPQALSPQMSPVILTFTAGIAVLTGLFFGLAPALQSLKADIRSTLGEGSRGGTVARDRKRVRNAFVVGQVAVALALLVGASALASVADSMINAETGYRQDGLLTFTTTIPEGRYPETTDLALVNEELGRRLASVPGVEGVALMARLPRSQGLRIRNFALPADAADPEADLRTASVDAVNPAWFETMEVELQAGRPFTSADGPDAPRVAVVDPDFVRIHLSGGDAIGQRIIMRGEEVEIVGVAEQIMHQRVPLGDQFAGLIYLPLAQSPLRSPAVAVRAAGDPSALASAVREAVWSVDPELPVTQAQTLDEFVRGQMAGPRFLGGAVGLFGVLALILSAMGIWGVISHSVQQRRREIGIRMALGAESRSLVGLVSKQGFKLTALGLVVGAPLAFLIVRFAGGITAQFEADLGNPVLYVGIGAVLLVVSMLASWLPSIRAARVQPTQALAQE